MDIAEEEISQEPENEFAFETDHLALRNNADYCKLLKYIVRLEAQKVQALKDIEDLAESHNLAQDDPLTFVQNLQTGTINFPPKQTIDDLPNIDWSSYGIDPHKNVEDHKNIQKDKTNLDLVTKVRGLKFTDSKPDTFNQLWSIEEQKRLEELLLIYPEERFEARRYAKISKALGTRTPLQVMSRIQKYFNKLAQAGMPIPGRAPKKVVKDKKNVLYKKSTFFPKLHVPVKMDDLYESGGDIQENIYETKSEDKTIIDLLKSARDQRLLDEKSPVWQTNTMCVGCHKTKFLGAKWTDNAGTDYCTDCVVKLLPTEKLIPVRYSK